MSLNPSHGLPFLPGNSFRDATKSAFHRPQTLTYRNGFSLPCRPTVGIGQDPLLSEQLMCNKVNELSGEIPALTYGSSRRACLPSFIPAHVAYDKKVLRFYGYFQQAVLDSPEEVRRVRHVVIYYYLEDDSMCVIEPLVENSGIPQGKLVKRQRLPKNGAGEHYHWKNLNISMDLPAYGVTYRITHCDAYTKEFMENEGLVLNDPDTTPDDPYITRRTQPPKSYVTPSDTDQLQQFLTMDRKVLRFFALWDDSDSLYGESRPVTIQYYLVDGTVEVREVHQPNSGRDPFPVLMRRQRLPKTITQTCEPFPSCVLEVSPKEVQEYYSPRDFQVGEIVKLLSRRFLLYDCDAFTRSFYETNYPDIQLKPSEVPKKLQAVEEDKKMIVPPYNGFGSLEDSLQNCLSLIPERPKKDTIKLSENEGNVLRYVARLDSQNPLDEGRRFILSFHLCDDMLSIFEKPSRNSGIIGGKFLEKARVPKPGCSVDNPVFYLPADFAIGATVEVFRHRFVLIDADRYVLKYLESVSDQIPSQTLDSLRRKLGQEADQGTADAIHQTNQNGVADALVLLS